MTPQLHSPRMAPRRRRIALLISLLAATLLVAGCGGSDSTQDITGEPFLQEDAEAYDVQLDNVAELVAAGDCEGAVQKVNTLSETVSTFPADVDGGLKDDLRELLDRLSSQISEDDRCEAEEEPTTTDESTTDTDDGADDDREHDNFHDHHDHRGHDRGAAA